VESLFKKESPQRVIHLAAQAGVRYSIDHPQLYVQSNIVGTFNVLEGCRHNKVEHLVYASSSSVYGLNTKYPFSVHDQSIHPTSLYGATKISNELMAHSYSHLYKLPTTGLRFFTVYGPWGRPDMAYFLFTKSILASEPIDLYNQGNMTRDFTYIEDIVEGVCRIIKKIPEPNPNWSGLDPDPASSTAPYRLYNIGSNRPIQLMNFVQEIERNLGIKAKLNLMPMQDGDIKKSHADVDDLVKDFEYSPKWNIQNGIKNFIQWYIDYYNVKLTK
jgi:UDP-glucuronate 4-epimerase